MRAAQAVLNPLYKRQCTSVHNLSRGFETLRFCEGLRPCAVGWPTVNTSAQLHLKLSLLLLSSSTSLFFLICSKLHQSVEFLHRSLARTRTRRGTDPREVSTILFFNVARAIGSFSLDARLLGPAGSCRNGLVEKKSFVIGLQMCLLPAHRPAHSGCNKR